MSHLDGKILKRTLAFSLRIGLLRDSTRTSTPNIGEQPNDQALRCVGLRAPRKFEECPIHRPFSGCDVAA